jgi:hypothetical protein
MRRIQFNYRNHKGHIELRTIELLSLDYEGRPNPQYGYGPGFFLKGRDFTVRDGVERDGIVRSFALTNIQMDGFNPNSQLSWSLDLRGESIIDFLAWASTQDGTLQIGAGWEAGPAVEALKAYEADRARGGGREPGQAHDPGQLLREYAVDGQGGRVEVTTLGGQ